MRVAPPPPQPDGEVPLVRLAAGAHDGALWVSPAYRARGYERALADVWLRAEVAARVKRAAAALAVLELGLVVWDGWRSLELQQQLWEEYRAQLAAATGLEGEELDARTRGFVSPVSALPAHSTGGAVDLSLCSLEGEPLEMGGEFDELSERSHPGFYERPGLGQAEREFRDRRRLLAGAMDEQGFERLPSEWWHFEYGTPSWAQWTGKPPLFGAVAGLGVT
jgi:zinc D-Ala-D-Ala dipeptidase